MAFCVFTVSICALFSTDPKNKSIPIISANLVLYTLIHRHKEIDFLGKEGGREGGREEAHTLHTMVAGSKALHTSQNIL
jgi:hypothetical protein